MRSRLRGDAGAVVAETAIAIPAALVVLSIALGALGAGAQAIRLQDAASSAARAAGRGDDPTAALGGVTASMSVSHQGGLVCVTLSDDAFGGLVPIRATGCADAEGG